MLQTIAAASPAKSHGLDEAQRMGLAVLIPAVALGLQLLFWGFIQPYGWFLFFPAVFFSSWAGGFRGGVVATGLSTVLVLYFFIPPRFSFAVEKPISFISIGMFVGMGFLFSHFHERLRKANAEIGKVLLEVRLGSEELQRRTDELRASNQELDAFVYAVSHDLRAPLRAMSGFGQALEDDFGPALNAEAKHHLSEIKLASRHMGELIDGLLQLSRSMRGELRRDRVDLSAMAAVILGKQAANFGGRLVWTVDPGLSVCGDARLIELLLTNLLENAVKYSAKVPQPTVRFYREGTGAKLTICVTDNGVGFDMRHAAKLFQPFQRLHRQDEFPGIGIGLATVQRIVLRHKGSIWANSTPGQGTTVSFNLPDAVQVNGDVP